MSRADLFTLAPTIVAFLALLASIRNGWKIKEIHITMNSRLTELLRQTGLAQHAVGKAEGRAEEKAKHPSP